MENPFKKLNEHQEVPKELKKKVMGEVAAIKLAMDLTGLFTSNYAQAAETFLKNNAKK